jgi:uncharacterized protein (DUF779 family)
MNAVLRVLFHSLGGFAAGSFYMPYDKVKLVVGQVHGYYTCQPLF